MLHFVPRSARRTALMSTALATLLFGFLSTTTPAAYAAKPVPGDNGDVKVHAVGTSFIDQNNEPHVCRFYLDAFNFDSGQQVSWTIDQQPPTGRALVAGGSLTMDQTGAGHTGLMLLPTGHYKLFWTFSGEKGAAKHKTFWSDCAGVQSPPPGSTVISSGGTVLGVVNAAGRIVPAGRAPLAKTGVDVMPMLATGTALILGGTLLLRRRPRKA